MLALWGVLWTVSTDHWVVGLALYVPVLAYLVAERRASTGSGQSARAIVDREKGAPGERPSKLSLASSVLVGAFCAAMTLAYYDQGSFLRAVVVGGLLFFVVIEFAVKLHRSIAD